MVKLLCEVNWFKIVFSVNVDYMVQIEGLMDDVDFKVKVICVEFEELCVDLFEWVFGFVQQVFQSVEMSLDEIEQVILVGGVIWVFKVQEVLLKVVGKEELGKNINVDEVVVMGVVYQVVVFSKVFKVKLFVV